MKRFKPLPYKSEFLLEMTNNNYSQETVFNYDRDLSFFAAFLWTHDLQFEQVEKLTISSFKGFLQKGEHLAALNKLEKYLREQKEKALLVEQGFESFPEENEETESENESASPDSAGAQGNPIQSRSKGSKRDFTEQKGLSPRSINRMLSALRNYFKFLIEIDQDVPIPPDAIKLLKAERRESQVANLDDLLKLIEAPEDLENNSAVRARNRAILELLFSSGMRISELVNLNREQLEIYSQNADGIGGKLYIKGKGKKSRFIYLTERAKLWLHRYLETRTDEYPALFIPYRGGRAGTKDPSSVRISTNYIQDKIVKYRRALGIVVPTSAHSLRHGFATYLAEEGANPAAIQRLLGHESLQTTTKYVHASDKFAEKAHRKFHPVQEN